MTVLPAGEAFLQVWFESWFGVACIVVDSHKCRNRQEGMRKQGRHEMAHVNEPFWSLRQYNRYNEQVFVIQT